MATIYYQTNKKSGIRYAYSSEAYWDPVKKAPRSRNTFLGRVDEETGEIIPKKKRKGASSPDEPKEPSKAQDASFASEEGASSIQKELQRTREQLLLLTEENQKLREGNEALLKVFAQITALLGSFGGEEAKEAKEPDPVRKEKEGGDAPQNERISKADPKGPRSALTEKETI